MSQNTNHLLMRLIQIPGDPILWHFTAADDAKRDRARVVYHTLCDQWKPATITGIYSRLPMRGTIQKEGRTMCPTCLDEYMLAEQVLMIRKQV